MKDIGQRTLDIGQRTLSMVRPRPKPDEEFSDGVKKKRKRWDQPEAKERNAILFLYLTLFVSLSLCLFVSLRHSLSLSHSLSMIVSLCQTKILQISERKNNWNEANQSTRSTQSTRWTMFPRISIRWGVSICPSDCQSVHQSVMLLSTTSTDQKSRALSKFKLLSEFYKSLCTQPKYLNSTRVSQGLLF